MPYTRTVRIDMPHSEAIEVVRKAFADQGFGVITEIDMSATLEAKIGAQMEPYVILGACNPQLAHRAVQVDSSIGALLPCNVVVRTEGGETIVDALDPAVMSQMSDDPALGEVAEEAGRRIDAALQTLRDQSA
ncbi:MAG: DUF302 domain-containing protein [Microthrixaceae bacterium]|nr:DUF302 domain-containing protein [Microthrixaceae bacterium]